MFIPHLICWRIYYITNFSLSWGTDYIYIILYIALVDVCLRALLLRFFDLLFLYKQRPAGCITEAAYTPVYRSTGTTAKRDEIILLNKYEEVDDDDDELHQQNKREYKKRRGRFSNIIYRVILYNSQRGWWLRLKNDNILTI